MRITLVGSRHFGVTTFKTLRQHGVDIVRVVVHDYFGVSLDIVWDVVENHLGPLRIQILPLLPKD